MVPDHLTCWVFKDIMTVHQEHQITTSWYQLMAWWPEYCACRHSCPSLWWELNCGQMLKVSSLCSDWSPVPAKHWPMITLLVSPKGKTHKGSVLSRKCFFLYHFQSWCLSYCTRQQEIYSCISLYGQRTMWVETVNLCPTWPEVIS